MWTLALPLFATLAIAVDCKSCPRGFEPLNKTMRKLTMNGPMTWSEVDKACTQQFGVGFQMLDRDFLVLSEADKELCRGHSVPLRLSKDELEPVVWTERDYLAKEVEVISTYLTHMHRKEVPPRSAGRQVGSLDLSTGQWHLVDDNVTFDCSICQRGWVDTFELKFKLKVKSVGLFAPYRPPPYTHVYSFRLFETGRNSIDVNDVPRLVEKHINETLGIVGYPMPVKINRVPGEAGVGNATSFRLKSVWWILPDSVLAALNGSFSLEFWQDANFCPHKTIEGLFWDKTLSGEVGKVQLQDSHVATRWCSRRKYPDGDWDAVWSDEVLLWIDRQKECMAREVANFVRRLEDFAERVGPDSLNLKTLVEITANADELDLQDRNWQPEIDRSRAIVSALSALLSANATNVNESSVCQGNACALLAADFQVADGLYNFMFSHSNSQPSFLHLNKSSAANQTTFMSLQLPQALNSAGHLSVDSWGDVGEFVKIAMIAQVVSSLHFNESERERSRPPVTFHVKDIRNGFFIDHYRSVYSLGDSKESSLPCPLVRSEGSVYTYSCNKWKLGPRNFISGAFIVNTHKEEDPYNYKLFVKPILIGYSTILLDEVALTKVASFTNMFLKFRKAFPVHKLGVDTLNPWQEILSGVVLSKPVFKASLKHVKVLVSDLTVNDPVVGLSFGHGISRDDVAAESAVDLVLGGDLQEHCKQLAILAVSGVADFDFDSSLEAYIKRKLMLVYLVVTLRSATDASSENVYFEIQLPGEIDDEDDKSKNNLDSVNVEDENDYSIEDDSGVSFPVSGKKNHFDIKLQKLRFQVATWSEVDDAWRVSNCAKRRSTRASKKVFRCEGLTIVDGALCGRYLVFEPISFAEALGPTFLAVLIAAGVMSSVSLASITGTAIFLPAWRKDVGHKILLQMTLALSSNLTLGFISSFVSVDTESVACVVVGALRHFSHLAMFAWMLVMSSLQLRRLLSVLGSRGTSNLLLKVSFFAWGVPSIVVGSLLTFQLDMYQSDTKDRGYCYPEGTAFKWSVQVPAATVLALNAFIFFVILARLYSFFGWGKTVDLRRHLNERAFQMRRLRAVFFTFFVFGITWLFHLLAEQGVFQTKFLYEYLFLLTASVHVFSLSCIFVFFDPEARAEWAQVVAPLRVRFDTSVVSLRVRLGIWIVSVRAELRP